MPTHSFTGFLTPTLPHSYAPTLPHSLTLSHQCLEPRASERHVQVLGARRIRRDEGQVDVRLGGAGQLALGPLSSLPQPLQGQLVARQVDALLLLELIHKVVKKRIVEILSAQKGIPIGGLDLRYN